MTPLRQRAFAIATPSQRRLRSRWWLKLLAVGFGFALFGLAELLCVLFSWGRPELSDDPFVGFNAVHSLFTRNPASGLMETAPSRRKHFAQESFAHPKPRGTFRVFAFGESTVQGNPWSKETAFTSWLRLSLEAAGPERAWEVVNCGGISYASYRLANIVRECAAYQPDLFILCVGHNEFLEDRTYTDIKHAPAWISEPQQLAARLRTFQVMNGVWQKARAQSGRQSTEGRTILKAEVDPWLDYEGGLKVYHRDPAWHDGVIAHYEVNLRRMISMAQEAGVPLILVRPSSNLRDCPPFKSQHREGLSEAQLREWNALVTEAAGLDEANPRQKLELLRQALAIDGEFAATHFQIGKCLDALGQGGAKDEYMLARELDVCPLRMLAPMEQTLARVAKETGTPLIDAHELLESRSQDGILGDDWLVDHIHPSVEGHQVIASALLEEMTRHGWVQPAGDWQERRQAAFKAHRQSLPPRYFAEGERALEGLHAWTEGRASGPQIDYRLFGQQSAQ